MEILASAALRSLILAAVAWAAIAAGRVKSPAARHAVWTLVAAGMLALAMAGAALPALPVRVLPAKPQPPAAIIAVAPVPAQVRPVPAKQAPRPFPWQRVYAAGLLVFAVRLAYAYRLTRKLARAGRLVEPGVYECPGISVPLTVGWLRPRILLPVGWNQWEPEKLQAVLAHECNHVRRGDWAIAVLAGVNRCVFWFHPLAWWLESHLKTLAELACDDASLAQVASREGYAQVLVEMAAAIRPGEGRVGREAMAMARGAEVKMRVERILDESRRIFPPMTRARWTAMTLCALPLVYLAAVARPARVQAQQPQQSAQELDAARANLAGLEAQISQLKPQNIDRMADQVSLLDRLEQEKRVLETQLQALQAQRHYYALQQRPAESEQNLLHLRLQELQLQLERDRDTYSPRHPRIRSMEAELAALTQRLEVLRTGGPQADAPEEEARYAELLHQYELASQRFAQLMNRLASPATGPRLTFRRDPEYTPAARQAGLQGKVELSVTIGTDGIPSDIQVTRGLDTGLDQKAIECVKSWRFTPASRNGEAVAAFVIVEVPFRLQ